MTGSRFAFMNHRSTFRHIGKTEWPRMRVRMMLFFSIVMNASGFSYGELYIWTDEHGRAHYSDQKPKELKGVRIEQINHPKAEVVDSVTLTDTAPFRDRQNRLKDAVEQERKLQKMKKADQEHEKNNLLNYCTQLNAQISERSTTWGYEKTHEEGIEQLTKEEHHAHARRLKQLYKQNCSAVSEDSR